MTDPNRGIQAYERLAHGDDSSSRGSCKKCGGLGHLTFECKNSLKLASTSNALNSRDPFADEKSRLRAEIDQLKREKEMRRQKKEKRLNAKDAEESEDSEDSREYRKRSRRRRSRSPSESSSSRSRSSSRSKSPSTPKSPSVSPKHK